MPPLRFIAEIARARLLTRHREEKCRRDGQGSARTTRIARIRVNSGVSAARLCEFLSREFELNPSRSLTPFSFRRARASDFSLSEVSLHSCALDYVDISLFIARKFSRFMENL